MAARVPARCCRGKRAPAAAATAGSPAAAVRPRRDGAAEHHQPRRRRPHPRFWVLVVLTGIAAGLLGALMMLILFNVQYAAFGYHSGTLQHGVEQASDLRRVSSLLIAGVFGGSRGSCCAGTPGRAVGDRRRGLERRRAAVVPALPRHIGHLRGRHRHGRLDRSGSRAQAARRRVGQRPGRLGRPVGAAAAAAGGLRRRRRARRGLQRPAGRPPVHRRAARPGENTCPTAPPTPASPTTASARR